MKRNTARTDTLGLLGPGDSLHGIAVRGGESYYPSVSWQRTAKEMIRDGIARSGLNRLYTHFRKLRGQNVDHLLHDSLSDRFAAVYANRVWLRERSSGALSGLGSELHTTAPIRERLPDLLSTLGTETLLDVGCGDFTWMKEVALPCNYVGVDVVRAVIDQNKSQFAAPGRLFRVLDATKERLPSAHTVLCREMLFHLSFEDIWHVLANIRRSDCKYLIATNHDGLKYNSDILSGDYRMLNLHRAPFRFPPPSMSIRDDCVTTDQVLSVWRREDLPSYQRRNRRVESARRWRSMCDSLKAK